MPEKANYVPGLCQQECSRQVKKSGYSTVCGTCKTASGLRLEAERRQGTLERITTMIIELEQTSEERLREGGFIQPGKEK